MTIFITKKCPEVWRLWYLLWNDQVKPNDIWTILTRLQIVQKKNMRQWTENFGFLFVLFICVCDSFFFLSNFLAQMTYDYRGVIVIIIFVCFLHFSESMYIYNNFLTSLLHFKSFIMAATLRSKSQQMSPKHTHTPLSLYIRAIAAQSWQIISEKHSDLELLLNLSFLCSLPHCTDSITAIAHWTNEFQFLHYRICHSFAHCLIALILSLLWRTEITNSNSFIIIFWRTHSFALSLALITLTVMAHCLNEWFCFWFQFFRGKICHWFCPLLLSNEIVAIVHIKSRGNPYFDYVSSLQICFLWNIWQIILFVWFRKFKDKCVELRLGIEISEWNLKRIVILELWNEEHLIGKWMRNNRMKVGVCQGEIPWIALAFPTGLREK